MATWMPWLVSLATCVCFREVRRERDHADETARSGLPSIELGNAGRADILERVSSAGAVCGTDVRPLHMNVGDRGGDQLTTAACFGDRLKRPDDFCFRSSDDCREVGCDAGGNHLVRERDYCVRIGWIEIHIVAPYPLTCRSIRPGESHASSSRRLSGSRTRSRLRQ